MNPTMRKFGWPRTVVRDLENWVVLARPAQPTLGSLVLAAKASASAFSELPPTAHAELAEATAAIERALSAAVGYDKINYLMLMMADPDVHFHVIPRYDGSRTWMHRDFPDAGWPRMPDLGTAAVLEDGELDALAAWLRSHFG